MPAPRARGVQHTTRMSVMRPIRSEADLEDALAEDLAVLYKHSPYCGLSSMAHHEVHFFAQGNPEIPIYVVDVIHDRPVSQHIARHFEIEHESPQVILLRKGRPVFDASHRGVSAYALEQEIGRFPAA